MSQQFNTTGQVQGGQSQGYQSGGTLPQQKRTAIESIAQAVAVCGWCADQCVQTADPSMIECIRLCEDVVELGEALIALGPRSSRYTGEIAQAFQRAAQACAQECGQHQMSHCQECANVLPRAGEMASQLAGGGTMQQSGGGTGARQSW